MSNANPAVNPSLLALAHSALAQGIEQVKAAGSPLHPFFMDENRALFLLLDTEGGVDPMTLALPAIRQHAPGIRQCALVIDSRIGYQDGRKWDAIVVMACAKDEEEGIVLAQRYVPKGWFRRFRIEGEREQVGKARNFIQAALEQD